MRENSWLGRAQIKHRAGFDSKPVQWPAPQACLGFSPHQIASSMKFHPEHLGHRIWHMADAPVEHTCSVTMSGNSTKQGAGINSWEHGSKVRIGIASIWHTPLKRDAKNYSSLQKAVHPALVSLQVCLCQTQHKFEISKDWQEKICASYSWCWIYFTKLCR